MFSCLTWEEENPYIIGGSPSTYSLTQHNANDNYLSLDSTDPLSIAGTARIARGGY